MNKDINAVVEAEKDNEEPAETCFNNELLEFKFLPEDDALITGQIIETYSKLIGEQTKSSLNYAQKLLMHGIRLGRGERGGFICVICDMWVCDNSAACINHFAAHQDIGDLLCKTKYGPVVGLGHIVQYRKTDDDKSVGHHECTLCNLFFDEISIFWHVLSFVHKENFYRSKFSNEIFLNTKDKKKLRVLIDEALVAYEKSNPNRGEFIHAPFEKWMISSATRSLNMRYIQSNFPSEVSRMRAVYQNSQHLIAKCENGGADIKVHNQHQLQQGKEILQKLNKAVLDFTSVKL